MTSVYIGVSLYSSCPCGHFTTPVKTTRGFYFIAVTVSDELLTPNYFERVIISAGVAHFLCHSFSWLHDAALHKRFLFPQQRSPFRPGDDDLVSRACIDLFTPCIFMHRIGGTNLNCPRDLFHRRWELRKEKGSFHVARVARDLVVYVRKWRGSHSGIAVVCRWGIVIVSPKWFTDSPISLSAAFSVALSYRHLSFVSYHWSVESAFRATR